MAKILIIIPYFSPDVSAVIPLAKDLIHYLLLKRHRVKVITANSRMIKGRKSSLESFISCRNLHLFELDRFYNPFAKKPGIIYKFLEYCYFMIKIIIKVIITSRYDLIYIYSNPPFLSIPLKPIAYFKRSKIVYDLEDLFPNSLISLLGKKDGVIIRAFIKPLCLLEKINYNLSDVVVTICESYRKHVKQVIKEDKIILIENWVNESHFRPVRKEDNIFLKNLNVDLKKFIVTYVGTLGYLQDMDLLVEIANMLKHQKEIMFIIVGDGARKMDMMLKIRRYKIDNCLMLGFQPEHLVPQIYAAGDLGIIPMRLQADPMPSKTWNYLACGVPIMTVTDMNDELYMLVKKYGFGIAIDRKNVNSIPLEIVNLSKNKDLMEKMGSLGREFILNNHSLSVMSKKYDLLLEKLSLGN